MTLRITDLKALHANGFSYGVQQFYLHLIIQSYQSFVNKLCTYLMVLSVLMLLCGLILKKIALKKFYWLSQFYKSAFC